MTDDSKQFPLIGVGVVVWRDSKFLLIKRGKEPRKGRWSLPGGKQQFGETLREASLREVEEETGLTVTLTNLIDVVDSIAAEEHGRTLFHYTLIIFCSEWKCGEAHADDDAIDVCWLDVDQLDSVDLWEETKRVIRLSSAQRNVTRYGLSANEHAC